MPARKESPTPDRANEVGGRPSVAFWRTMALVLLGILIISQFVSGQLTERFDFLQSRSEKTNNDKESVFKVDVDSIQASVIPEEGVVLPIVWGNFGKRMMADEVIDEPKFRALFPEGVGEEEERILSGEDNQTVVMTPANSHFLLNMLWAFGLANKNEILTAGEMTDERYGGDAGQFASTGGWSLAKGNVMNHYSTHPYVVLSEEQQARVDRVSAGIYRPCCGNSTHFPDCNHGMAMLGLLELMAANNVSEEEMYAVALKVNSYWFPQTYLDLATYFQEQGQAWDEVDPKLVLGAEYSSGQGYASTRAKIKSLPSPPAGGGGCGV